MAQALFMLFKLESKGAKVCKTHKCKSCRFRQELSNGYLYFLAKLGFDTAENGPLKIWHKSAKRFKKRWTKHRSTASDAFEAVGGNVTTMVLMTGGSMVWSEQYGFVFGTIF